MVELNQTTNEIVKVMLAYCAGGMNSELNPSAQASSKGSEGISGSHSQPGDISPEGMDPATRANLTDSANISAYISVIPPVPYKSLIRSYWLGLGNSSEC